MSSVTHKDIYKEVQAYLLGLFSCPPQTVIQGYQNNSPLPDEAVVMTILFENELDMAVSHYDPAADKTAVQQSVEVTMQVDCYGPQAAARARKLSTLWKNHYTTATLKSCQPLYSNNPKRLPIINEKSAYEDRWLVELALQYNPYFEHGQTFLGMPQISINP